RETTQKEDQDDVVQLNKQVRNDHEVTDFPEVESSSPVDEQQHDTTRIRTRTLSLKHDTAGPEVGEAPLLTRNDGDDEAQAAADKMASATAMAVEHKLKEPSAEVASVEPEVTEAAPRAQDVAVDGFSIASMGETQEEDEETFSFRANQTKEKNTSRNKMDVEVADVQNAMNKMMKNADEEAPDHVDENETNKSKQLSSGSSSKEVLTPATKVSTTSDPASRTSKGLAVHRSSSSLGEKRPAASRMNDRRASRMNDRSASRTGRGTSTSGSASADNRIISSSNGGTAARPSKKFISSATLSRMEARRSKQGMAEFADTATSLDEDLA
ncbi:unnamed protein product, partial [Amoebophrya sp. A25]